MKTHTLIVLSAVLALCAVALVGCLERDNGEQLGTLSAAAQAREERDAALGVLVRAVRVLQASEQRESANEEEESG